VGSVEVPYPLAAELEYLAVGQRSRRPVAEVVEGDLAPERAVGPVSQAAIISAVTHSELGKEAGTNNMIQELGGAFGVAAGVAMFTVAGSYASPATFADGFAAALGVSAGLAALGFAAALLLPRRAAPSPPPDRLPTQVDAPAGPGVLDPADTGAGHDHQDTCPARASHAHP
jgi:hypothetical protein